jgi:PAS domain S-box-containing protein
MTAKKPSPAVRPVAATDAILESISDGVFTVDDRWRITSFNRAAEKITGIPRGEAIGRLCSEVFRSSMCETECALRRTVRKNRSIVGRSGYIIDANGERIPVSVSTAVLRDAAGRVAGGVETFRDLSELEALKTALEGRQRLGEMVSRSATMQKLFAVLPAIAESPSTVLLSGETGTGKELMARTLHALSPRRSKPFVAVNCGAMPDTLLESELFGYKRGAFTGAFRDKPGRFALAAGGTLFLDEIAEVSPALQIRLLRVLQERCYEPLGAVRSEKSEARIIAATNKDLARQVRLGLFREDLFYRVNVVHVDLPPLRERREDIPILVEQFVARFNRLQRKSVQGISSEALSLLMAQPWPGNIRELENLVERAFILCHSGLIGMQHLPEEWTAGGAVVESQADMRAARSLMESHAIHAALKSCGFNRLRAAQHLGIHKSTLFRKLKRLGIAPPKSDRRGGEHPQAALAERFQDAPDRPHDEPAAIPLPWSR